MGGVGGEVEEEAARYFIAIVLCVVASIYGVWMILCCGRLSWGPTIQSQRGNPSTVGWGTVPLTTSVSVQMATR